MDFLPEKLKQVRTLLGLNQTQMADAVGMKQKDVSQLENGERKFIPNEVIRFMYESGIDLNSVFDPVAKVRKAETGLLVTSSDREAYQVQPRDEKDIHITVEDHEGNAMVCVVSERAAAGWAHNFSDEKFYRDLPKFPVPRIWLQKPGEYFALEISGNSMVPTIADRDTVLVRRIMNPWEMRTGMVGVVLTIDGLLVKRFEPLLRGLLRLHSDNPRYENQEIHLENVVALFQVESRVTKKLDSEMADLYPIVSDLQRRMIRMESDSR